MLNEGKFLKREGAVKVATELRDFRIWCDVYIGVARGRRRGPWPPPNQNATNDKNVQKKPCFFSFTSFIIFAYNSTPAKQ